MVRIRRLTRTSRAAVRGREFYDPATPELGVQTLAVIRYLDSFANTFHHGLQMKMDKRFSNGVAFGLAYTYSKSHGDGENGGQEGAQFQESAQLSWSATAAASASTNATISLATGSGRCRDRTCPDR